MENLATNLQAAFLLYVNEYLTMECFADHHHITLDEAEAIINAGRIIHESRVAAAKAE